MDGLSAAWRFLKSEKNRKALAFVGGGIAAVAIGGWQIYSFFVQPGSSPVSPPVVTADGGGVASGGDIHIKQSSPGTLIAGGVHDVRPEDFQRVSEELGITKAALASFFKVLEKQHVSPEHLDSTLREFAKRYKALEADLARSTSDDPEVAALKARAREALEAGDFDRAEQLLNEASAKDLATAERQESVAKQRRLSAAQAKSQNGALKWTQFAYREAAGYFRQAAALLPHDAEEERTGYLNLQGLALHDAGDYRDAEEPYTQALALREKLLGPEHPDVATSLNNLGRALSFPGLVRRGRVALSEGARHRREGPGAGTPQCGDTTKELRCIAAGGGPGGRGRRPRGADHFGGDQAAVRPVVPSRPPLFERARPIFPASTRARAGTQAGDAGGRRGIVPPATAFVAARSSFVRSRHPSSPRDLPSSVSDPPSSRRDDPSPRRAETSIRSVPATDPSVPTTIRARQAM